MSKPKKINLRLSIVLALIIIGIAAGSTTFAAISVSQNVPSSGGINASANLGVYSDSSCQTNLTSINWGNPTPGTNVTRTIYIKNTGIGMSLALSISTSGWNPASTNGPITLTWNQEGTRLSPGQSTSAVLNLVVSPTIVDISNFSVQVSIIGTN